MRVYQLDIECSKVKGINQSKYAVLKAMNSEKGEFDYVDHLLTAYGVFHASKIRENSDWVALQGEWFWDHKPRPDLQMCGHGNLFVSGEKKALVEKIDGGNFEYLPIKYPEQNYYFIRLKDRLANSIDREKSLYTATKRTSFHGVQIFSFNKEIIDNQYLFLTPELYGPLFATENFKQYVQQNNLKGLDFKLIWDSEDPDYHDQRYRLEQWNQIKKDRDEMCANLGIQGGNLLQLDVRWQQFKRGELKL
jgi:hypothetical protein